MLDGKFFFHDKDLVAEVPHLFAQLGINRQLMAARLILQINPQQDRYIRLPPCWKDQETA